MFLSDRTIKQLVAENIIIIDPFEDRLVQPCSYDVTLGEVDMPRPLTFDHIIWSIQPGEFLLASTIERIKLPNSICATLSGKSTWGRKGLAVHITAGHVDPGWDGELTLEMYNHSQEVIVMRQGTAIAQLVFTMLDQPAEHPYAGRYQGSKGIIHPRASVEFTHPDGLLCSDKDCVRCTKLTAEADLLT